jgi:hypothetical protein
MISDQTESNLINDKYYRFFSVKRKTARKLVLIEMTKTKNFVYNLINKYFGKY